MVQITICWGGQFQGSETDVVQRLVVDAVRLISVLNQLVNRQSGVVRFHYGVRHFRRRNHAESIHNSVGVLLPDFGNEKCSHAGASSTTEGVC